MQYIKRRNLIVRNRHSRHYCTSCAVWRLRAAVELFDRSDERRHLHQIDQIPMLAGRSIPNSQSLSYAQLRSLKITYKITRVISTDYYQQIIYLFELFLHIISILNSTLSQRSLIFV